MSFKWSEEEIILVESYPVKTREEIQHLLPNRTWDAIQLYAERRGITRRPFWTEQELDLLKKFYVTDSPKMIQKAFPDRTWEAIKIAASTLLGIKRRKHITDKTHFESYLMPIPECGCLIWTGGWNKQEYGSTEEGHAHRVAWKIFVGPIPDGFDVLHKCNNPPCCRIDHLYLGDDFDNARDRKKRMEEYRLINKNRGEASGRAKLTETQVLQIRSDPRFQHTIAAEYGVSKSLIWAIKKRHAWKHVP